MSDHPEQPDEQGEGNRNSLSPLSAGVESTGRGRALLPRTIRTDGDPSRHETANPSGGLSNYLHAFRRRWFSAISIGLLCGAAAGAAAWLSAPTMFTSTAIIRISAENQSPLPFQTSNDTHTSFDIYKGTQMQLLTSDFVLDSALRKLPNFPILRQQEDPIRWLARSLQTETGENSEVVRVNISLPDGSQATAIVQAVVDAYMTEVADKERKERDQKLSDLDHICNETEIKIRSKWQLLKKLAEQVGSGDNKNLSRKEQWAIDDYGHTRAELNSIRAELGKDRATLAARLAMIKARQSQPERPADIDAWASKDAVCVHIQQQMADLEEQIAASNETLKQSTGMAKLRNEGYSHKRSKLEEQLADRRRQLAEQLQTAIPAGGGPLDSALQELQFQIAGLEDEEKKTAALLQTQKEQCELFGNSSIDVEIARDDLDELKKVMAVAADQREKMQLEPGSQLRIKRFQNASTPLAPDKSSRVQNAATFGLLGFFAPIGLLLWWDGRAQRINTARDVIHHLGLPVIGSVPRLPVETRAGKLGSRRHRQMQVCLDHSIDAIAAKLFLQREQGAAHIVLVSSATRGEGKSTLSMQLAKRLARTGASTLLVDFDMRKPTLHHMIDEPRGPGLSEFLRGESELGPLVRPTGIENLSLLTAGSPFLNSLGALSNGVTRSLFDKVRDGFDFVIVDGTPILPVVDALLIGQHVDSVILSMRRDVSQLHRVRAACERLSAFGVEDFAAVLTGTSEEPYDYEDPEPAPVSPIEERPKPR